MCVLPVDDEKRSVGARAKAIVHYRFDSDHWEYRESTGVDVGVDCIFELTDGEKWIGNRLYCQIKGRTAPKYNQKNEYISIELKASTVNYALSQAESYVLLLVDIVSETVYYLALQEYFIADVERFERLTGEQKNITLRIPTNNIVSSDDYDLQEIAKSRYVGGPGKDLHRAQ